MFYSTPELCFFADTLGRHGTLQNLLRRLFRSFHCFLRVLLFFALLVKEFRCVLHNVFHQRNRLKEHIFQLRGNVFYATNNFAEVYCYKQSMVEHNDQHNEDRNLQPNENVVRCKHLREKKCTVRLHPLFAMRNVLMHLWLTPRKAFMKCIGLYQATLSPDHGLLKGLYPYGYCRHHPTCSVYGRKIIEQKGIVMGGPLLFRRILSCHPWTKLSDEKILHAAERSATQQENPVLSA
ncbi:hypothetical protein COU76_03000 [Candidatus Peregrinibacteria bacterium CG10_big_fil_rev_8_21_14_0_10_49_10]|nr:MAG: hypothetical protein COU76_03000 [Candidatus Peregrinibacteria bacterium CG10_big_fil_rev_8_21_14_0_10_49_10]